MSIDKSIEALLETPTNLWTVVDAAKFLGFSESWVYHRAEAGLLPHIKIAGRLRFEPDTLKAFIRKQRLSASVVLSRLKKD
ncbi:MAG: helix-turn-helix domain-containing protein [Deltaproteobacteria bacterium]|nr:helix-turn-helix domain-containing protein [Deltaproteobacteria bacterium]